MNREEVLLGLTEIFREIFDDENLVLFENMTAKDIEGWDSLEHINILAAITRRFNVKFSLDEAGELKNVGYMVDGIYNKLKN